jgi:membrane protein
VAGERRLRWVFAWHDARNFVRRVWEGVGEANIPFLASGLAFDLLLAAVPFVIVVLALIGYVLNANAAASRLDLTSYLRHLVPSYGPNLGAGPFEPVIRMAADIVRSRDKLSLFGLPLFVFFATRLFGSLRAALCEVFDTRETRPLLKAKLADAVLVLATGLLIVLNIALSEGIALAVRHLVFVEYFAAQLVAFGFLIMLFVMIFEYAPARRIRWDTALVAALACAVGFDLAKELLSLYFRTFVTAERFTGNATLGGIILLVGWVYYMTFVFLIGAQIAQVYELRRRQAAQRAVLH